MNLTDFVYYAKKYGPITFLSLIFLVLLFYALYLLSLVTKPEQKTSIYINPIFGKLELPKIKTQKPSVIPKFELDTIEGVPITATSTAKIWKIKEERTKLTYRETAYLMANTLGFDTTQASYKLEDEFVYFEDSEKILKIDIKNYNFEFYYKPEWIIQNINAISFPENELALQFTKEILNSLNKYSTDLVQGKTNLIFVTFDPDEGKEKIIETSSLAQAIKIDFFRKEEEFPIVSNYYPESQNYVIVTLFEDSPLILKAQIKFFEILKNEEGIYPLITGDRAFEKLQKAEAFFIKLPKNLTEKIYIKKMFLAYYEPEEYTPFFQPVYVFLGKDFIAYVPAVREDYLK